MRNKIKIDERVSPIEAFPDDNKLRVVWAYGALYKNIGKTRVPYVDILLKEITLNPNTLTNNHTCIKISVAQLDIVRYMTIWCGNKRTNKIWAKFKNDSYHKLRFSLDTKTSTSITYRESLTNYFKSDIYRIEDIELKKDYWHFANATFTKFIVGTKTILIPSLELFTSTFAPLNPRLRYELLQYNLDDVLDEYIKSSKIVDKDKYLIELKRNRYKNSLFLLAYAKFNEISKKRIFNIRASLETSSPYPDRYPVILPYHPSEIELDVKGVYLDKDTFLVFIINGYTLPHDNEVIDYTEKDEYENTGNTGTEKPHQRYTSEIEDNPPITGEENPHSLNGSKNIRSSVRILKTSKHKLSKIEKIKKASLPTAKTTTVENTEDIDNISSGIDNQANSSSNTGKVNIVTTQGQEIKPLVNFSLIIDALKTLRDEKEILYKGVYINDFKFIDLSCNENSDYVKTNFLDVLKNTGLELNRWIEINRDIKEENSKKIKRAFVRIRRYLLIKIIFSNNDFFYLFEIDKKKNKGFKGFIFNLNIKIDEDTLIDLIHQTHDNKGLMKKVSIPGHTFKHFVKNGKIVDNLKNAFERIIKL
ncbi:hypothetical protein [Halarcobacter bivalviorum]|uniref:hypothetical protein n=1 Tax=Halarcobacter bivalviorum TaxID=663364 RepID=UPI00100B739F|nr:hypothetical protein [Halarcobacter bivalviorum]RXK03582.1 hypothetical protein CRU97_12135 [Halarcobacter bivalviorum]